MPVWGPVATVRYASYQSTPCGILNGSTSPGKAYCVSQAMRPVHLMAYYRGDDSFRLSASFACFALHPETSLALRCLTSFSTIRYFEGTSTFYLTHVPSGAKSAPQSVSYSPRFYQDGNPKIAAWRFTLHLELYIMLSSLLCHSDVPGRASLTVRSSSFAGIYNFSGTLTVPLFLSLISLFLNTVI